MESHLEYRDNIRKTLGASVSTDVFLDPAFYLSAFLFDEGSWVGQSRHPSSDFKIVHNPNALSPLPDGCIPLAMNTGGAMTFQSNAAAMEDDRLNRLANLKPKGRCSSNPFPKQFT